MHRSHLPKSVLRGAVLGVVLAVVALLPGVAWAGTDPVLPASPADPVGSVTGTVGGVVGGIVPGQAGAPGAAAPNAAPAPGAATQQAGTGPSLPPPPPLDASQLQQLLAALGISKECSTAVQKDIEQTIADLPATVQAIIDAIVSQLPPGPPPIGSITLSDPQSGASVIMHILGSGQPSTFTPPAPPDLPIAKDLQQLVTDLQTKCQPSPPTTPPAADTPAPPPQEQPVSSTQPAPAPPAQPVSYPGYAPTGAPPAHSSDGLPLAALAGIVLLSAAGAASYRMVFRAGPRS